MTGSQQQNIAKEGVVWKKIPCSQPIPVIFCRFGVMTVENCRNLIFSKHSALADHDRFVPEEESGTTRLMELKPLGDLLMDMEEGDKKSSQTLAELPALFTCPSFYWTCLNAFLSACPKQTREHLSYLSCKVHNCLLSAATATRDDGSPLKVLVILGRNTEFDAWFVHNLMLYHSTGLHKSIHYNVVKPNSNYNQMDSSVWEDSEFGGMFLDMATMESFEPMERYDIILMSHSLDNLPRGSLQWIFYSLLVPEQHGYMIIVEAPPPKGSSYPNSSLMDIDSSLKQIHEVRNYLEDVLATLDPQDSMYEVISVDGWTEVEDACKDPATLNVEMLSFCTGKDLRNVQREALMTIQDELSLQILIRMFQYPCNPSCFAVVYNLPLIDCCLQKEPDV